MRRRQPPLAGESSFIDIIILVVFNNGATKRSVGILHVKVIRALNLCKMDLHGKSDPYVKLKLSGEKLHSKKTTIKICNLNPEWNENFKLRVKDPEAQGLELHVFDWEKGVMTWKAKPREIMTCLLSHTGGRRLISTSRY